MSRLLTWYRLPQLFLGEFLALLEPLIAVLLVGAALFQGSIYPILGGWISFALYVSTVVLIDEHTPRQIRMRLAQLSILLFPLFYLFSFINFIAMIKVLRNWRQLVGLQNVEGSWTPPTRVGKAEL